MTAPLYPLGAPAAPDPDAGLRHITDHKERALARLLEQFKDKARLNKLIEILSRPFQELEDVYWQLYVSRRLSDAVGDQLDQLGKIVAQTRDGNDDETYRAYIRVKIRILKSRGRADDLLVIARLLGDTLPIRLDEVFPAMALIRYDGVPSIDPNLIYKLLRRAKAGGVRVQVMYETETYGAGSTLHVGSVISGSTYPARVSSLISSGANNGYVGGIAV